MSINWWSPCLDNKTGKIHTVRRDLTEDHPPSFQCIKEPYSISGSTDLNHILPGQLQQVCPWYTETKKKTVVIKLLPSTCKHELYPITREVSSRPNLGARVWLKDTSADALCRAGLKSLTAFFPSCFLTLSPSKYNMMSRLQPPFHT